MICFRIRLLIPITRKGPKTKFDTATINIKPKKAAETEKLLKDAYPNIKDPISNDELRKSLESRAALLLPNPEILKIVKLEKFSDIQGIAKKRETQIKRKTKNFHTMIIVTSVLPSIVLGNTIEIKKYF